MRIAITVLALLALCATPSSADTILTLDSENSRIAFGTWGATHEGLSEFGLGIDVNGVNRATDWSVAEAGFIATTEQLTLHTLETDGGGTVTGSIYQYQGGTFEMNFVLENQVTGATRSGSFVAPIVGMTLFAGEGADVCCSGVAVFYELGKGLFAASIANALQIRPSTKGGWVDDPFLLIFDELDHTAPDRRAWEGASLVTIDVPEPASLLVFGAAVAGVALKRRRRR